MLCQYIDGARTTGSGGPATSRIDTGRLTTLSPVVHQPVGVRVLIPLRNYPLRRLSSKVASSLAADNTCAIQPTEATPLSSVLLAAAGVVDIRLGGRIYAPIMMHGREIGRSDPGQHPAVAVDGTVLPLRDGSPLYPTHNNRSGCDRVGGLQ